MATVEEFVQSCCTCAAVAFCCGNSPLGPQRRIAAAQAQIDSNPALHGLVRGVLRLPSISFSRAFLCDLERNVTRFFSGNVGCRKLCMLWSGLSALRSNVLPFSDFII